MSRVYADPVDVQRHDVDPTEFLWRGRLYQVRAVLSRWSEAGRWWRAAGLDALDDAEREYWRVEAAAGRSGSSGVFDLCFDWSAGRWFLSRAHD
jgi:hypothetical protein